MGTEQLSETLAGLAPGVVEYDFVPGEYHPRKGLAIYIAPPADLPVSAPGVVLGEALSNRSGLGCTMLAGIPANIPDGAVLIGLSDALESSAPALLAGVTPPQRRDEYVIALGRSALVTARTHAALAMGMQTLAMLILRHQGQTIPGVVIRDYPRCQERALAVELTPGDINPVNLTQIVSFAATFKANQIHWLLPGDFHPSMAENLDSVTSSCASYGIAVEVRLPLLGRLLSGRKTQRECWTELRAAAKAFGAQRVGFDDPCPPEPRRDEAERLVQALLRGDHGLPGVSVDARLFVGRKFDGQTLRSAGVTATLFLGRDGMEPSWMPPAGLPLQIEVPANLEGMSAGRREEYWHRLDTARKLLEPRHPRDVVIAFRNIGISHAWQNFLSQAATGLIAAWGRPVKPVEAAAAFGELIYGAAAGEVEDAWDALAAAFPPGLSVADERRLRRIAFGRWPDDSEHGLLASIDWRGVIENINRASAKLDEAVSGLTRNHATLSGAYLGLQALAWLCRFAVLMPELERRRFERAKDKERTDQIAAELSGAFDDWRSYLVRFQEESGMPVAEMGDIDSVGLRLKGLCQDIFE